MNKTSSWEKWRKDATLYDVKTSIPAFVIITGADIHDSKVMDQIPYEENSFYVFERAYMATKQLFVIAETKAFFVVREKHRMVYEVTDDREYNNPATGILADQNIKFTGNKTKKQYPNELRRIVFYDKEENRPFVFYTNNMDVKAEDIALLYKYRWSVELFFKWVKQHLRIKEFYGTSENAVKFRYTQPLLLIVWWVRNPLEQASGIPVHPSRALHSLFH